MLQLKDIVTEKQTDINKDEIIKEIISLKK
jgi:hypothetical protein